MRAALFCSLVWLVLAPTGAARADTFTQSFFLEAGGPFPRGTGTYELNTPPPASGGPIAYGLTPGYSVLTFSVTDFIINSADPLTAADSNPAPVVLYDDGDFEGIDYDFMGIIGGTATGSLVINGLDYYGNVTEFGSHHSTNDQGTVQLAQAATPEPSGVLLMATGAFAMLALLSRRRAVKN